MIHYNTHSEFLKHLFKGCLVIELGDQLMDIGADTQFMRSDEYYRWKHEANITSVDIHGRNRVLKHDLSKLVKPPFEADIVSDFGTIEHVKDLYNALLNTHNFCKVGGTIIHSNPKAGTYEGHGHHYFIIDFWKDIAAKCSYETIAIYEQHPYSNSNPDIEVVAVLKKTKHEFPNREELGL